MKLHLYAQQLWHDPAWIVGDKQALYELREAIDHAIKDGNTCLEFETSDGEGYSLYVAELGSKEMAWEQLDLPYTDRSLMGFKDIRPPNPPYSLITPERHKELRTKLLKNSERTCDVSVPEIPNGEYSLHADDIPTETFKAKARVRSVDRSTAYDSSSLNEHIEEDGSYKRR